MDPPPPPPPTNADPPGDPEQAILELLQSMETYRPVVRLSQVNSITSKKIPDAVLDYYLLKSGFNCQDIRVYFFPCTKLTLGSRKRLLGLAAQKFVSDVAADAYKFHAIREQNVRERARGGKGAKVILAEY